MKKVLVTGTAGFIGFHLSNKLLQQGFEVFGIDNLNSYYDINLKNKRLEILKKNKNFSFKLIDISNCSELETVFSDNDFSFIFHLAAQAGVRYSFENPQAYIDSNINGFINILESCKTFNINKLFYASSSSVYGDCKNSPLSENDLSIKPISLYGITKRMNEELAEMYFNLFSVNSVGLRFFTVYGPWGRPDMAYYKFIDNIINDNGIDIYNNGNHSRSFTYIDDVINSIYKLYEIYKANDRFSEIYNIGGGESVKLNRFISIIENLCKKTTSKKYVSKQNGDVENTEADCSKIFKKINYKPNTDIEAGLNIFYSWYKDY